MADYSLGIGVRMMRVTVNDTRLPKVAETAFRETIVVAGRQVTTQLVDSDLQNESRPLSGLRSDAKR